MIFHANRHEVRHSFVDFRLPILRLIAMFDGLPPEGGLRRGADFLFLDSDSSGLGRLHWRNLGEWIVHAWEKGEFES